ncbi:Conserved_hypothetical protein [Hexamita inflata]|uniref:Uncharacterized protein n=1 Tax=Hexamita inflata TaxID=28002 RepID=A0AA86PNU2_9EUKA|nr:Conserved hypothetical protein [Hexamita inflata]
MKYFYCYLYPNISINGELSTTFVPQVRKQLHLFKEYLSESLINNSVDVKLLGYGVYLNDINTEATHFAWVQVIIQTCISFVYIFITTYALIFSLLTIVFYQVVLQLSNLVISVIYKAHGGSVQSLNPYVLLINSFFVTYFVCEFCSKLIMELRIQYVKSINFEKSLDKLWGECLGYFSIFVVILLTGCVFQYTRVVIIQQIAGALLFDALFYGFFVVPISVISMFGLIGVKGLWPSKMMFGEERV